MKLRVIAVLLVLLLLAVTFVTGVFAAPDDGDDTAEDLTPVAETTNHTLAPETTAAAEAPEPVETSSETIPLETGAMPVETNAPVTEPATESPEPTEPEPTEPVPIDPEPQPPAVRGENRLTLRVDTEKALDRDLLFVIRCEGLSLEVVLPAGASEVTVVGLPAGSCTVALDTNWNWQLELKEAEAAQTLSLSDTRGSQTVTFRPEAGPVSWLNASAGGDGK